MVASNEKKKVKLKKKKKAVKPRASKQKKLAPKSAKRDMKGRLLPGSILPARGKSKHKMSLTVELRKILEEKFYDENGVYEDKTRGQHVMDCLIRSASTNEPHAVTAAKEILNRIDGKVPERIHHGIDTLAAFTDEQLKSIIERGL